ncbi:hypothetical protein NQZ68_020017 [Dissostichus eleginoides]|nr:hypothetical protein NQZ68_020017 [Dissostichus eleginoides]
MTKWSADTDDFLPRTTLLCLSLWNLSWRLAYNKQTTCPTLHSPTVPTSTHNLPLPSLLPPLQCPKPQRSPTPRGKQKTTWGTNVIG